MACEFTANYNIADFNAYVNASYERAEGRNITSSQFEFDPGDLAYIATHYIPLDHQQIGSVSAGASYNWDGTHVLDRLSLWLGPAPRRRDPQWRSCAGLFHRQFRRQPYFDMGGGLTARLDVINLFDEVYEIRDGTGIGVGAPQFGARRGFFVGISKAL